MSRSSTACIPCKDNSPIVSGLDTVGRENVGSRCSLLIFSETLFPASHTRLTEELQLSQSRQKRNHNSTRGIEPVRVGTSRPFRLGGVADLAYLRYG